MRFVDVVMDRCSEGFGQRFCDRRKLPDRQYRGQNENRINPGLEHVVALFLLLHSGEQCVGRFFSLFHSIDVRHSPQQILRRNEMFALRSDSVFRFCPALRLPSEPGVIQNGRAETTF
jgi:hypothetical protein